MATRQLSSTPCRHVPRFLPLSLLLILLTLSSSLSCVRGGELQNLQAGTSLGANNVIANGVLNRGWPPDTLASWQTLPGLYFWLSPPVPSAEPPQPSLANMSMQPVSSPFYLYLVQPAFPAGQLPLVSADPLQPLLVNFSSALCNVQQSSPMQHSELTMYVNAAGQPYDTINLYFTHDCYYPRINVGSTPASVPDILQSALVGERPQLVPNTAAAVQLLAINPARPVLTLYVSATWQQQQWPLNSSVSFYARLSAGSSAAILSATTVNEQLLTVLTSLPEQANVDTVPVVVTADCEESSERGWVLLTLSFYFAQNISLNVSVQCGRAVGESYWPNLQVSSAPSSTCNVSLPLVSNGRTTAQFQQGEGMMLFPVQQRFFTLNLSYSPAPAVYSLSFDAEALSAGTVGNVVGATWGGDGSAVTLASTIPRLPGSGSASITIETQCVAQGTLTVRVTLGGTKTGQGGQSYTANFLYLSMTCTKPLFNLSTTANAQQPNLVSAGRIVPRPAYSFISSSNAFVIPVVTDTEAVQFWLSMQTPGPTVFTWRLLPGENYANVAFIADGRSFQGASLSQGSSPQLISSFPVVAAEESALPFFFPSFEFSSLRCLGRDAVSVVTELSFGWGAPLQLQFMRECAAADYDGSDEGLDAAGVVAVVFTVMITALCCLGCGYNYRVKHQRGWAMVPGHGWWQRVQDSTLGPKRYTPQMDDLEEGVEIHNTRPVTTSSGYGTYGSAAAADGYGAADGYMGDL